MRCALTLVLLVTAAGCGGDEERLTLYFKQHLGSDGPPGQVAPVLEPVARERRDAMPTAQQVVVQLRQGPTPDERARGFLPTVPPGSRGPRAVIREGTAFVENVEITDVYAVAAIVFSLTELDGVERVRVCCRFRHDGSRVFVHERSHFRGWQGAPCASRDENLCLRDR